MSTARERIEEGIDCSDKARPWIRYRLHVAAGDIGIPQKQWAGAQAHYETARSLMATYEGEGYEIHPRLGIAYLGNDRLADAQRTLFELLKVTGVDNIESCRL